MKRIASHIVAACLAVGCIQDRNRDGVIRVLCVGDSNTAVTADVPKKWCEHLNRLHPRWEIVNAARAFTATDADAAQTAIDATHPDAVLIAWGTNDVGAFYGRTPESTAARLVELRTAIEAQGIDAWVALVPPQFEAWAQNEPAVERVNRLLRESLPPEALLDFWTDFDESDFADGLHCTDYAQMRRARIANRAVTK